MAVQIDPAVARALRIWEQLTDKQKAQALLVAVNTTPAQRAALLRSSWPEPAGLDSQADA